jgi:putative chitinase
MLNRSVFYDHVRGAVFSGSLSQDQVAGMENLLNVQERYLPGMPLNELAYDFGTAAWETARTMQPITERGQRSYFNKYEPGTRIGDILGNTQPGDGYRYRGEGHVQNTGRRNASVATKRLNALYNLGIDLVKNPEQRGDPLVSALSLYIGNREGCWTGKDIDDYIDNIDESDDEDLREFANARRIVNGTDKAVEIGKLALAFEKGLQKAGYKAGKSSVKLPVEAGKPSPTLPLEPGTVVVVEEKGYKKGFWQRLFDWIFPRRVE